MRSAAPLVLLLAFLVAAWAVPAPARAAGPSLTLTPAQGPPQTPVTVQGDGYAAGASVDILWHTMEGNRVDGSGFTDVNQTVASATADAQGRFSASFAVPYDLGGPPHTVEAVVGGAAIATASFTLERRSWITPTEGPEGTTIEVRLVGGGWTQYDNNIGITYDNAFLGFACSFNSQGNISVWVQAVGGVGPHVIGVYPALYYGPSDGPTPWKHAALSSDDLPVRYEPKLFTFAITSGSGGVSRIGGTDLHEVTTPDSLSIPSLPAVAADDGTPRLAFGNAAKGVVGGDLPYALAGFSAGASVELRWNSVTAETKIGGTLNDKFQGWVLTPTTSVLASLSVDATGKASGVLRVPADFGGMHEVEAVVGTAILASAGWMTVPRFTASLSGDGTEIELYATGLGSEKYTAVWDVLYDGKLFGWVSAMTSRGSVDVSIPAIGEPGLHTIDIHEGSNAWPYLNMHQSPWPWEPVYRFAFSVPPPSDGGAEATVPLWLTAPIILAALVVGFLVGVVRRRKAPSAPRKAEGSD